MKNFREEKGGIFKNEIEIGKLKKPIFLKLFRWGETTSSIMKFIERLEDENIKYAIEGDKEHRCQKIYIEREDKTKIRLLELSGEL